MTDPQTISAKEYWKEHRRRLWEHEARAAAYGQQGDTVEELDAPKHPERKVRTVWRFYYERRVDGGWVYVGTSSDAAKILGCSARTVLEMNARGELEQHGIRRITND